MDNEPSTDPRPKVNTAFEPVQKNLVQTAVQLRVWDCHVDSLPRKLTYECRNARLIKRLYYPYWRLALDATVKALWLPPRRLRFFPSVDAVTGQLCVVLDRKSVV